MKIEDKPVLIINPFCHLFQNSGREMCLDNNEYSAILD